MGVLSLPIGDDATHAGSGVPRVVLDDPQQLIGYTIVGRFRVDGVLGVGGMGAVLRCHHKGLQRDIAVKVLHPQMSSSPEIAARFAREAQAMSRMNHPNCVRVLDFGEFEVGGSTMQYLAMELLSGCELSEVMARPLSIARAAALMDQICAGLAHAHAAGVVHRDLKPENVFVTTDHEGRELLKIVDFGIAKIVSGQGAKDNMTVAGTIFGTPRYMSPEQCAGGTIDARTDVYAAGIILYEMLAGHVPFDDPQDPIQVIHKHILEPVPPLPSTVPPSLSQLVLGMLEKEKAHRVASIELVQARLAEITRELVHGTTPSLRAATWVAPVVPRPRQSGLVIGGLALALGVGVAVWVLREPASPPPKAAAQVTTSTPAAAPVGPSAPSPSSDSPGAIPEPVAALLNGALGHPAAPQTELTKLDAMLADGAYETAADTIRRLLDAYPKDARLHVRNARTLRETDAAQALAAYAKALELDPALAADEAFVEELLALMRRPGLEAAALDLAIRQLGKHGASYLVERVNDQVHPIAYPDRHRALQALEALERSDDVEVELNVALDLWQASEAKEPCVAYGRALGQIEEAPAAYYLGTVMRSTPPERCADLQPRQDTLGETLRTKFAVDEADWVVPAAYAKKRSKRGRRGGGGLLRRLGIR